MSILISHTPTYTEIFEGEIPELKDLLKDIDSFYVFEVMCCLNAQLVLHESDKKEFEIQAKLLIILLNKVEKTTFQAIQNKLSIFYNNQKETISIFGTRIIQSLINYELGNFKKIPNSIIDGDSQIKLFKAYLLCRHHLTNIIKN